MKTPACRKEFTSEWGLQTRLTTHKCKNATMFFILLTTFMLSPLKPGEDSSSGLSRGSHLLSTSSFTATASLKTICSASLCAFDHHDSFSS